VGIFSTVFLTSGAIALLLSSPPNIRGRVMALRSVTFLDSTPVDAPTIGAVADHLGPRAGFALGAVACLVGDGVGACRPAPDPSFPRPAPALEAA
jgi:hypothetical protein